MSTPPTVVSVATLDTKGSAAQFLRDQIVAWGLNTLLIDPGIVGTPTIQADVTRSQVAQAAGTTLEVLIANDNKAAGIASQTIGLRNIVTRLWGAGNLDGIIGLGGGQGTALATAAMRALPVGVPKLMLSTIACGQFQFGTYVGTKDICMMHSVTDILDANAISHPILTNAANAIAGMTLRSVTHRESHQRAIAITQLGMTTPCVMSVKEILETRGYQLVPFHANGVGGLAMEDMIDAGEFVGAIDLTTHEIMDGLHHGLAGAHHRLEAYTRRAIPAVISVGGNDYVFWGTADRAPEKYRERRQLAHNAEMTVFLPTIAEMIESARAMVEPLNRALGPTIVAIPARGFSDINRPGRPMWFPEGNRAMIETLARELRPEIPVISIDAHINEPIFAQVIADCIGRLLSDETPRNIASLYA